MAKTCRDCVHAKAKGLQTVYCRIHERTFNLFWVDLAEECEHYRPK
jgi:hypothetical protein